MRTSNGLPSERWISVANVNSVSAANSAVADSASVNWCSGKPMIATRS
jgi:hypothetical protein